MDLYMRLSLYQRLHAYAAGYLFLAMAGTIIWDIGKLLLR